MASAERGPMGSESLPQRGLGAKPLIRGSGAKPPEAEIRTTKRGAHLPRSCIPILLYGLECFQLGKAELQSLDFTFNCLCMKLFKTGSIDVVKDCLIVSVALLYISPPSLK